MIVYQTYYRVNRDKTLETKFFTTHKAMMDHRSTLVLVDAKDVQHYVVRIPMRKRFLVPFLIELVSGRITALHQPIGLEAPERGTIKTPKSALRKMASV